MRWVTAVHMLGTTHHQHIGLLRWVDEHGDSGVVSLNDAIELLRRNPSALQVQAQGGPRGLRVVEATSPYVQAHGDGRFTYDLLTLPRF